MVPCGDAFGRTCWKGILGYLGHCLIWISGFEVRVRLIDAYDNLGNTNVQILQPSYGASARQVFL